MVVVGADVHKRTHTFVAVDEVGQELGHRQLNAAIHRIAVTQIRMHGLGKTYYEKKKAEGMSTPEALRCLKRRLARIVFNHLTTDHNNAKAAAGACLPAAA